MQFVKQRSSLKMLNFDCEVQSKKCCRHSELLPDSIRCIIIGPSNCGKTNLMLTLLTHPKGLRFENVYLYSNSLYQPKYEMLKKILQKSNGVGYFPYSNNVDIVKASEAKPNSIFIFDDVACDKQDCMRDYFSHGRHKRIDSFYLCQTYTRVPKQLIRDNANLIILFKQDDINLKHAYDEHVGTDMSFDKFKSLCSECWNEKYGFVVINKDNRFGRYRKGFDNFLDWGI